MFVQRLRWEYLSPQADSSFCEVLPLPLKVSLLLLEELPFLLEALLLLQRVAVVEQSRRLLIERRVELLLHRHKWIHFHLFVHGILLILSHKTAHFSTCSSTDLEELLLRVDELFALLHFPSHALHFVLMGLSWYHLFFRLSLHL